MGITTSKQRYPRNYQHPHRTNKTMNRQVQRTAPLPPPRYNSSSDNMSSNESNDGKLCSIKDCPFPKYSSYNQCYLHGLHSSQKLYDCHRAYIVYIVENIRKNIDKEIDKRMKTQSLKE